MYKYSAIYMTFNDDWCKVNFLGKIMICIAMLNPIMVLLDFCMVISHSLGDIGTKNEYR